MKQKQYEGRIGVCPRMDLWFAGSTMCPHDL